MSNFYLYKFKKQPRYIISLVKEFFFLSQTVSYEADERGFKPHISYEDSDDASARSGGYDSNANNVRNAPDHGFGNGGGYQNGAGNHGSGQHGGKHGGHGNARSNGY